MELRSSTQCWADSRRVTRVTVSRQLFAVAAVSGLLSACYESPEPLAKPGKAALDSQLSGEWLCKSPPREGESQKEAVLWVIPFDSKQYFAEWREGDDVSRYRAYPTQVGHDRLLNVEELTSHLGKGWVFFRYSLGTDGTLRLSVVSEDALGGLKGKAALEAIRHRVADDSLYEAFAVCRSS